MRYDDDRNELKDRLRELPTDERKELLRELEAESRAGYPTLDWSPNPEAAKFALNFIASKGTVTFEELRQALHDQGYTKKQRGVYTFGIVSVKDDDLIFETDGARDADTKITLTETGKNIAGFLDDDPELRPCERPLFFGLQPSGPGATFLAELDKHPDGVLRQEIKSVMVDRYGKQGEHETGYYSSLYSSLGLIKRERDEIDGRRSRYYPDFPST